MSNFLQVTDNARTLAVSNSLNNITSPITLSGINTTSFEAVTVGYAVTIWNDVLYPDPSDDPLAEKALVTAATIAASGSFTLTRPNAVAHTGAPRMALLVVAQHLKDVYAAINTAETNIGLKANTSSLATVATTGSYTDLTNKPTIPSGVTNLSTTAAPTTATINSSTGTSAVIAAADATNAGLLLPAEKTKITNTSGTNTGDQTTITGNSGTATALQTGRTIAITGDVAYTSPTFNGSANVTAAGTLATVNSNVGSFGTASSVPSVTVNAKGLTTAAVNTPIQIPESQVTNLTTDLAGKQPTLSLTTTGTSGAATLISNTLNIPNYATGGGSGDMTKVVYDTNNDGVVDNSQLLQGQNSAYHLSRANHTGTQAESTITNLVSDLAAKQATLVSGTTIKTINGTTLLGSGDIVISGGGGGGTGLTWSEVTGTTQAAAINNAYITNNAGVVTVTLPATAVLGSIIKLVGKGAGGWLLAQNSGQVTYFGTTATTSGATGNLASTKQRDVVEVVCTTADTEWTVIDSIGSITVV